MKKKKLLNLAEDFDKQLWEPLTESEKRDLDLMAKARNEDGSFNARLYGRLVIEDENQRKK